MSESRRIGFVGLGAMGSGMAGNFLAKGYALTVIAHRNRASVDALLARGASEAADAADLAARSDVVFLCVRDSTQVEAIVDGPRGLLAGAHPGLTVVDTTTSDPASTARLYARFAERGVEFVDAPLGRSVKEAAEGRLNVMVGATQAVFDRVHPVLTAIGENIFHVGGPGSGHKAKLINNFVAMGFIGLLSEGFGAAKQAGVNTSVLYDILSNGPMSCPSLKAVVPSILSGTYDSVKFELDTARKDLRYYRRLADEAMLPTLLGDAVHQLMMLASLQGLGSESVVQMAKIYAASGHM